MQRALVLHCAVTGADLARLLHMPSDAADALALEWGMHNKYHRKRFIRKLCKTFRAGSGDKGAPLGAELATAHCTAQGQDARHGGSTANGVPCTGARGTGSASRGSGLALAAAAAVCCSLCEDEGPASHACDVCGVLCSDCAGSHFKMRKGPFKDHVVTEL